MKKIMFILVVLFSFVLFASCEPPVASTSLTNGNSTEIDNGNENGSEEGGNGSTEEGGNGSEEGNGSETVVVVTIEDEFNTVRDVLNTIPTYTVIESESFIDDCDCVAFIFAIENLNLNSFTQEKLDGIKSYVGTEYTVLRYAKSTNKIVVKR